MGQYYKPVCLERQEYLYTHDFGDGLKLMEFGMSGHGTAAAMALMLTLDSQRRGPWAGKRIVVTGDYADEGRFVPEAYASLNLYCFANGVDEECLQELREKAQCPVDQLKLVPPFANAKAGALEEHRIRGFNKLKLRVSRRYGLNESEPVEDAWPALFDDTHGFDQLEDIFDSLGYMGPTESLQECLELLCRVLRVESIPALRSWGEWSQCSAVYDEESDKMKSMSAVHQKQGEAMSRVTLNFPATSKDVREFFGVQQNKTGKD